ncbi:MAG: VC0807 family protein [Aeromicrobium sp.]
MAEPPALPHLRDIVVRVAVSLLVAIIAPGVLFAATTVVLGVTAAMIVALAWMGSVISWRAATGRCVSALLVLTGAIMAVKTGITFATGNTFIYFVQPVFVDAAVATVFLASLLSARPLVARMAPDFCPMTSELAAHPRIRRLLRSLTLMWGLVILVKGTVTLWLLLSLSTVDFVLVKSGTIMMLTAAAVAATIIWSVVVARQEGLLALSRRGAVAVP